VKGFTLAVQLVAALLVTAGLAAGQDTVEQPATPEEKSATAQTAGFLAGGLAGLAAHESGHLLFDAIFNAHARIVKVSFHGVPFFAITHDSGLSPRKEFVIDSAGFWVQEATNEVILSKRPNLRHESAPFTKGVVAFNVLASVAYSGAAFARTGPAERDTRGMADALDGRSRVGVLILVPAILTRCASTGRAGGLGSAHRRRSASCRCSSSRGVRAGPSANVINPSTATLPSTRAMPCSTPMRLRSRFTTASMTTTSPAWTGRR
jgi:hypothetical protein